MLTDKAKTDFEKWIRTKMPYWKWLIIPKYFQLIFIQLFSTETQFVIDIQYWDGDSFDWAISKTFKDEVLISNRHAGNRWKSYNEALEDAVKTFNRNYNFLN